MKNRRMVVWGERFCRYLLAAVFYAAGFPKLLAPDDFAVVVGMYGLVPNGLVFSVAVLLPILEIVAATGLLFARRWALILTAGQMALFIVVLLYGIHLGLDIDCGCFGPEDPEHRAVSNLRGALVRDILLLIPLAFSWLVIGRSPKKITRRVSA